MRFLSKSHHSLSALTDTTQHFGTTNGGHFKQWSHQQRKHRNAKKKKIGTTQTIKKDNCLQVWKLKQEGRAVTSALGAMAQHLLIPCPQRLYNYQEKWEPTVISITLESLKRLQCWNIHHREKVNWEKLIQAVLWLVRVIRWFCY